MSFTGTAALFVLPLPDKERQKLVRTLAKNPTNIYEKKTINMQFVSRAIVYKSCDQFQFLKYHDERQLLTYTRFELSCLQYEIDKSRLAITDPVLFSICHGLLAISMSQT